MPHGGSRIAVPFRDSRSGTVRLQWVIYILCRAYSRSCPRGIERQALSCYDARGYERDRRMERTRLLSRTYGDHSIRLGHYPIPAIPDSSFVVGLFNERGLGGGDSCLPPLRLSQPHRPGCPPSPCSSVWAGRPDARRTADECPPTNKRHGGRPDSVSAQDQKWGCGDTWETSLLLMRCEKKTTGLFPLDACGQGRSIKQPRCGAT